MFFHRVIIVILLKVPTHPSLSDRSGSCRFSRVVLSECGLICYNTYYYYYYFTFNLGIHYGVNRFPRKIPIGMRLNALHALYTMRLNST